MNIDPHNLMERVRTLVAIKGWDYSALWKLSQDQRSIELLRCCCAGIEYNNNSGDEEQLFRDSQFLQCRDNIFQHRRSKSCDFLDQLPSIIPLDSGIYAETLISNQPNWLYVSNGIDSNSEEIVGTKVLIPLSGGLIDLFVSKQISEDQQVIDFITGQCNMLEEDTPSKIRNMNSSFIENPNSMSDHIDTNNHFQPSQFSPAASVLQNLNLQDENYIDSVLQCNSAMNFMDTFSYNSEHKRKNNFFWDYSQVSSGFDDQTDPLQSLRVEETAAEEEQQGNEKDSIKHEGEQEDPLSDFSDQIDDEDCFKYQRRTGKGSHCKNLFAERNRRKKLNERLYNLRALVPVISKLDRASILGDAIEYVKQLEKQVKELKNELEEHSEDDGDLWSKPKCDKLDINDCHLGTSGNGNTTKQNQDLVTTNDKAQQMEPQVEVAQLDGNEFFVKVFSEHKTGGFVRLIEALNSLGLEVTNANVTSNRSLVSNVFKVEKKDSEIIQACDLRDFIMELTQDPSKGWPKMSKTTLDNDNGIEFDHHQLCSQHINSYNFHHILLD